MTEQRYIACDLGAESGRVMLAHLVDGKLDLSEVHRFATPVVRLPDGTMRWNTLQIFEELKTGLRAVARQRAAGSENTAPAGISVDSWGVDYVYTAPHQPQLWPPFHYRDARTAATYESVRRDIGVETIFGETGIQFMPINTLYHLAADVKTNLPLLERAGPFLMIADFFNFLLSGVACVEQSNASTTQLYSPTTRQWSDRLVDGIGLPRNVLPKVVPSGTVLGPLVRPIADEVGLVGVPPRVIATCSHDTGAAVAAVPALEGEDWAYLSSGTWSLLGVELPAPLLTQEARALNFTNEAGFGGTTRLLKNIVGLWILQELRREWAEAGNAIDYTALTAAARAAEPFRSLVRPNVPRFAAPGGMVKKISTFCSETEQPVPRTPGEFARCVWESLALQYRVTLEEVESLTGRRVKRLHVVGGGSKSELLNQFTASAVGRDVMAGPVEATAIGNALLQALSLGHIDSLTTLRSIVRASFPIQSYAPADGVAWQAAFERFSRLGTPAV